MRLTLGVEYDLPPIPLDEERTTWFPAGPVRFGLEDRVLDEAVVRATYSNDERAGSAIEDVHDGAFADDGGLSVHVSDAMSGRELLRFDCFVATPHYHYIPVGGGNHAIAYDADANGDMVSWVADRLRTRLPAMLTRAGAGRPRRGAGRRRHRRRGRRPHRRARTSHRREAPWSTWMRSRPPTSPSPARAQSRRSCPSRNDGRGSTR